MKDFECAAGGQVLEWRIDLSLLRAFSAESPSSSPTDACGNNNDEEEEEEEGVVPIEAITLEEELDELISECSTNSLYVMANLVMSASEHLKCYAGAKAASEDKERQGYVLVILQ